MFSGSNFDFLTPNPDPKLTDTPRRRIILGLLTSSPQHPTKAKRSEIIASLIPPKASELQDKPIISNSVRKVTTMAATWFFCSCDGFEFVELSPSKPSLYQRYFDWRDNVSNTSNTIPASCRWEVDYAPRNLEFIEMRELPGGTTSEHILDDMDLEEFDDCKPREEELDKETKTDGLVRSVKEVAEFVGRLFGVGRQ